MITKLNLKNFKCYKEQSFDFSKLTVFCGNNSVGKSTAIQALAIPLQSKFSPDATVNGSLVTLGTSEDIFSRHASSGDENLRIDIHIKKRHNYTLSWGFDDFFEQKELKNHLALKSNNKNITNSISNYYFKDKGFQFLEAERFGPREYFNINRKESIVNWLGSKGEYSYEVFAQLDKTRERLPNNDFRNHINAEARATIRRNIVYWMSEISPGFNMESEIVSSAGISHAQFQACGSGKTIPMNMGFGLSYSLSIVIALLSTKPGGLVIIENPEAHLHPRGQSFLGRLIALTAMSGVQVIIETHSDHLLNGLRVISRLRKEYKKGEFIVYYVSVSDAQQSNVDKIEVGDKGELSQWPVGFFDQQAYDIKTIIKGEEVEKNSVRGGQ
ncbi:AAA family ATPase [Serratia quinivorans]|uniref:AAA family ATPase n=1 Tax=Serratia quinivorans TaxID=137545 RepID=UPI002177D55E|nr:DUF3696 domain-containing protein [Serratia quinivorans]CAI1782479.1 Uncharacterized conserved protein [Serratia quinivorans]CAI1852217.1 Uncharacterized conserved protein [Serratia quinivorans]